MLYYPHILSVRESAGPSRMTCSSHRSLLVTRLDYHSQVSGNIKLFVTILIPALLIAILPIQRVTASPLLLVVRPTISI